jgi:hypothetical protein
MDAMQKELKTAGRDVAFLAVNSTDAASNQTELTSRCEFPLFQDVDAVKAWDQHAGKKDDFFIYGSDGKLARYLPFGGPVNTNLSDPAAYDAVKAIVVETK